MAASVLAQVDINTVKLGYNDHGYNEFTAITNEKSSHFWFQTTNYYVNFHGYIANHGYNEHLMLVPESLL